MITDRIRGKSISAAGVLSLIENMSKNDEYDSGTLEAIGKKITEKSFITGSAPGMQIFDQFRVNEPFECVELLRKLNQAINLFYELEDESYYMDYIFNAGTYSTDDLRKFGITKDWCTETARKLEQIRNTLYGDNVDWDELSVLMMRNAAYALREDNQRLEDRNRSLEYKLKEGLKK